MGKQFSVIAALSTTITWHLILFILVLKRWAVSEPVFCLAQDPKLTLCLEKVPSESCWVSQIRLIILHSAMSKIESSMLFRKYVYI